jgi:hypothetical protein
MIFRKERHSYCFDSADDLGYFCQKAVASQVVPRASENRHS